MHENWKSYHSNVHMRPSNIFKVKILGSKNYPSSFPGLWCKYLQFPADSLHVYEIIPFHLENAEKCYNQK